MFEVLMPKFPQYKASESMNRGLEGERDNEGNFIAASPEKEYSADDKRVAVIMKKLEGVIDTNDLMFLVNYINEGGLDQNEN